MRNFNSCTFKYNNRIHTGIPFRKAIEMLKSVTTSHAVVRREGQVQKKLMQKNWTIGDIVILEEGDKIPCRFSAD